MNAQKIVLISALTLGLSAGCLAVLPAMAAEADNKSQSASDSPKDSYKEPKNLGNTKDRGLYAEELVPEVTTPTEGRGVQVSPGGMHRGLNVIDEAGGRKLHSSSQTSLAKPAFKKVLKTPAKVQTSVPAVTKLTKPAAQPSVKVDVPAATPANGAENVSHVVTDGLTLSAKLNKPGDKPVYKVGEKMEIHVKASKDCNLVVMDFDGSTVTQIFPNDYQKTGLVTAGSTVIIGGENSPFDYEVGGASGEDRIFIYAYPVSSNNPVTVAWAPSTAQSPFRSAEMTTDQYRSLVKKVPGEFEEFSAAALSDIQTGKGVEASRKINVTARDIAIKVAASSGSPNRVELIYVVDSK